MKNRRRYSCVIYIYHLAFQNERQDYVNKYAWDLLARLAELKGGHLVCAMYVIIACLLHFTVLSIPTISYYIWVYTEILNSSDFNRLYTMQTCNTYKQ